MATSPHARDARTADADRTAVDSRWWYLIAATPVYFAVAAAFTVLVVGGVLFGVAFGPRSPDALVGLGVLAVLAFLALALLGMALVVLFPVALYLDAEAVNDAGLDWQPDGVLYALVGAVAALASGFALSVVVAGYYLYRRHQHVGVP